MNKYTIAGAVLTAGLMLSPVLASAATISSPLFSNGDTTISATGGATVSGTFTLEVAPNEVCEVVRTKADASQPIKDTSVGGQLGYQEGTYSNVAFSVKTPPNTGTYWPTVQCAGIYGGIRAVDGADNVVVGPQNLGELRVVASGSTSGGSSDPVVGGDDFWTKLAAIIAAAFKANQPQETAACVQLKSYNFVYGSVGVGVQAAQTYVMTHGGSIAAGATGFWGTQSAGALIQAKGANNCN